MTGGPAVLLCALTALHVRERRRLVLAARARHEVRGPLCAAQLALDGLEPSARVTAIAIELRRAALALDDLAGAHGARRSMHTSPLLGVARLRVLSVLGGRLASPGARPPRAGAARCARDTSVVDMARLLADTAPVWRALADARGVALAVDPGPALVAGDPLRLAQACANLVHNAIEHGGGAVCVTSSTAAGRVRVDVVDQGAGLEASLPDLVASARGRRAARGHGLAIAAAIAERHGGRLTTIPAPHGAHLALELPEASRAEDVAARASRKAKPVA